MYNSKLAGPVLRPRAPEPGTVGATLVEVKPARLGRVLQRAERVSAPKRDSLYNRGWRWHLQLWAGILAIVEGISVIAITVLLLGKL